MNTSNLHAAYRVPMKRSFIVADYQMTHNNGLVPTAIIHNAVGTF